jgi:hypothetical protein
MKKLLVALCVTSALAIAAQAQEEGKEKKTESRRPAPTAEQKALRKEMLEKYDTNKDGKLDKEERAKISAEDKAKMEKFGPASRPALTDEQKAVMKEMVAKYDTNKDGKLDKEERAKISAEDKAKLEKAGLPHGKKTAE